MDPNCVPTVCLSDGGKYPAVGFGTYQPKLTGTMDKIIGHAFDCGYRLFDGALLYKNEKETGVGLSRKFHEGVQRSDIQIQSKLWNTFHKPSIVKPTLQLTLADLQLEYIDAYLIHWPMAFQECAGLQPIDKDGKLMYSNVPFTDTWKEFEKLHEEGLIRHVGVANFNTKQITKLCSSARLKPVINQLEIHPYLPNKKIVEFCQCMGIQMEAFSPLGSGPDRSWKRNEPDLKSDPDLKRIADKHKKGVAQVLLRYLVQRNIVPFPKAAQPEHISANLKVFDFSLDKDDMNTLNNMKQKVRYNHFDWSGDHPDYPFHED